MRNPLPRSALGSAMGLALAAANRQPHETATAQRGKHGGREVRTPRVLKPPIVEG